ncbi:outer membrane protein with beta-barrel domain [Neorhizobium sp. R1-B]|nr:outer membrane protein with beta-barrel domain [Neorhizobium sp. S3-V5DH]TDX87737.1 outer membrane protein with beta-barrel domain [Neorhizobium sp. R1-B]
MSVLGFGTEEGMFSGYTVGAGADYAFTGNIFARVEYRYSDFGCKTFDFGPGTIDADLNQHAVKVGLGVKFQYSGFAIIADVLHQALRSRLAMRPEDQGPITCGLFAY